MKKIYSLIISCVLLCFAASAWAQTIVLSENFDTADFDSKWKMVNCKTGGSAATARYMHGSSNARSGSYDFRFVYNSAPPQYLISKSELSIPDGATVYVSFYYKVQSSTYEESFQLGYSTTNNEAASFTWATEVKTKATSWTEYTTDVLPAGTKYIAIKYTANNMYYLFIDDIVVSYETASSCAKPTDLSYSNLEAETVDLSWTAGGSESAWNVLYKAGSAEWATIENVTENSYTLSLSPSTNYQVKVLADCGGDISSASNTISFTTPCVATTLPIENDFSSALSPCWTLVDCHSETTVTSGEFKFRYNTTPPQYLITPGFVASAKELQVEFDYRVASSSWPESFAVGYSTTTNAVSAFTWGTEQTGLTNTSKVNYSETLPAGVKYVAIKYTAYDKSALYIDNLKIKEVSSCHNLATLSDASAITSSGATFSWTTEGTENRFQYACIASGVTPSSWTLLDEDVFSHTVIGLSPETTYDFYVRAYCDESEQSDYLKKSFTTTCGAVSLPFEDNFTTLSPCWTLTDCETSSNPTGVSGGEFSFKYNTNPPQYLITPELVASSNELDIEFRYKIANSYFPETFSVGYSTTTNNKTAFTFGESQTVTNTSYTKYTGTIPANAKYVAIKYESNDKSRLYIDDFKLTAKLNCATPSGLSCSTTDAESATLSWAAGDSETAWVVEYSTTSDFSSDVHEANAATRSNFVLSGLDASTKYYVHVKAVCGVGDESNYSDAINFTTACPAHALPLEEDFSGSISCWTQVACTSGTGVVSGEFKFMNSTTPPQYLISPELVASAKGLHVEFDYRVQTSMYEESFAVGYSTTTNAISAFTWGTELTGLTNTSKVNHSETLPVGVKYVAIKYTANDQAALFIDDLSISEAPSCFKPQSLSAASNITPDGATFTWTASGHDETTYQWAAAAGYADPVWVDDAAHKVSTTSATVTGLNANTSYKFYVRSYCGSEDQSDAVVSASFTTATVAAPTIGTITTTNESAHAIWTAPDVTYDVQYQWSLDGSSWSAVTSNLYADISELEANHSYTFYVRSYYDATHIGSAVSKAFKTACDAITVAVGTPFEQNFDAVTTNAIPDCWNNDEGTTATDSYKWKVVTGGQSGKCAMFNGTENGLGNTNVFATPLVVINSDADLSFYWKNKKTGAYSVEISVDGASRTTLVSGLTGIDEWTLVDMPLTSYNGHSIQLFFCGTSANDGSANLYLDEFKITPVSCRKPASDPVVSSKDDTHATITWTAGGASNYQFCLAPAGTAVGDLVWEENNVVSVLTKTFDNLEPAHSYDFYVRTYCDELNQSEARMVSFRTSCGIVDAPFEENFNGQTAHGNDGIAPECWDNSASTMETPSYLWQVVNYSGRNGSKCLRCGSMADPEEEAKTNILVSPEIRLGAGKQLLTFWCKKPEADNFVVKVTKDNGANFTQLLDLTEAVIADWTLKFAEIPAAFSNQVVKFYFCNTANSQGDYIYIDDVRAARGEVFEDVENNETRLSGLSGVLDVVIGRTIFCDGDYNTICLPFSLSEVQLAASPLAGATFKAFTSAVITSEELQVNVAEVKSGLVAGVPYLLKMSAANNLVSPLFKNVTISATVGNTIGQDEAVEFIGTFNPVPFTKDDESTLFVYTNNTLTWSGIENTSLKGFRAYFHRTNTSAGAPLRHGMRARIVEQEETATGIDNTQSATVQSVKILENDHVVIIRNGVKYNIQGQIIEK